jgi:hypothetical protein
VAVEDEEVEEIEEDRDPADSRQPRIADPHPPLQALEAGSRALEGDDLTVGEEVLGGVGGERLDQLRVGGREVAVGARGQRHLVAVAADQRPDAVELALEDPARIVERAVAELGLHRLDGHHP